NMSSEWSKHDPQIVDAVIRRLPHSAKFAVPPRLWFYCRQQQLDFRVIDFGFEPSIAYWTRPDALSEYDVVILPSKHRLVEQGAVPGMLVEVFTFGDEEFQVFRKHADGQRPPSIQRKSS